MENVKSPAFHFMSKRMVLPFAVGMLLCSTNASAADVNANTINTVAQGPQKSQVTGRIVDSNGEPLIGVSVVEKGNKSNGTVTNLDGEYTVNVSANSTLVVSYVGYKTQEVAVGGKRNVNVTLAEDAEMLNDVVVIGYGVVKKADLAGSVAVMDNKAFKDQPITQASDALNGRMSGVNVVSDGIPGGSVKIRVRGSNSITKSNDPLYVVDGMVRESGLDGINPEDIQSMQVLKDASSTAIYGSRGANGVVIVTTKTGVKGETRITFDASYGFSKATNLPKMMSTKDYAQALIDYNGKTQNEVKDYLDGTNPGIDWVDVMFRNGQTQNYKLVFTKGTDGMQSYISANYMKNEGTLEGSQYERFAAKANIKSKLTEWLNVTVDLNASRGIGKGVASLPGTTNNPLWIAFNSSPTMNMFDDNGKYAQDMYGTIEPNAYGMLVGNQSERRKDVFNGHIDLQFNILPGLTFTTSNGVDYLNRTSYSLTSGKVSRTGQIDMGNSNSQRTLLQSTNNLTYTNTWGDHHLTATGVWEATKSTTTNMGITGLNLVTENVGWWNVENARTQKASNGFSEWTLLSGVGRIMYNFADKYMLTGTFRADGSSRFTNNKWGYFPSIAGAWTVTNEKFMEGSRDLLSNLKIRASYGVIGNQDIAPYSTLALLSTTNTYYGVGNPSVGYKLDRIATPDIKWEKTKQFDLGVDLGFFNNRLEVSLDYFNKQTSDALLSTTTSNALGGFTYMANLGKVANQGLDITVNARIVETKDFQWQTSLNGTYLKNEVKKLTDQQPVIHTGSFQSVVVEPCIIKEGEALGSFYGQEWAGIDSEGYDTYWSTNDSGERVAVRNPKDSDRKVLGKSTPDFTLGWNNTISYKNWSLNAFFNSAFGVQRLNALRFAMNSKIGNSRMFTDADFLKEIGKTMPNPNVANNNYIGASSKWVENANYFRCENITLAYDMPKSFTKFADIRLSFSVQNLFTVTNYKGSNPAGYNGDGDATGGIDCGTYPTPRTFTFGARFNF
ncbi:TonB-dependent receptor [uncultured Prevotella sp.]|uniref:SusC/RagA family TonB-linked outer membrane protein n=1 Tax=uncultured Prevotella sp. TaxID=159272 RepID=UPI0027E28E4E|nr:TonB-dependent receptor [uncultured Prevotella sp.]